MGLTGSLKTMTLPDLLQWVSGGKKTGTLVLRNGSLSKKIYFRDGAIIGSWTNDSREYLGQFLLSQGVISEGQLKQAFDAQARTRVMLGRILVQQGLVTEARVVEILRFKAEETVYALFLWAEAEFEFLENQLPPGDQVMITISVDKVLMEGLRRFDTSKVIRETLPNNQVVLRRTSTPLTPEIAARAFPGRLYNLVDGRRTIVDIILEAHGSEFNVLQALHVMVQKGFLEVAPAPSSAPAETGSPATEALQALVAAARELIKSGEYEAALNILQKIREGGFKDPEINALTQVAEEYFVDRAYRHFLPPDKIPVLKRTVESLCDQNLSPEEVFLVTRVNGSWDLRSIMSISPLREIDALRALKKLREKGIIDLVDAQAKTG